VCVKQAAHTQEPSAVRPKSVPRQPHLSSSREELPPRRRCRPLWRFPPSPSLALLVALLSLPLPLPLPRRCRRRAAFASSAPTSPLAVRGRGCCSPSGGPPLAASTAAADLGRGAGGISIRPASDNRCANAAVAIAAAPSPLLCRAAGAGEAGSPEAAGLAEARPPSAGPPPPADSRRSLLAAANGGRGLPPFGGPSPVVRRRAGSSRPPILPVLRPSRCVWPTDEAVRRAAGGGGAPAAGPFPVPVSSSAGIGGERPSGPASWVRRPADDDPVALKALRRGLHAKRGAWVSAPPCGTRLHSSMAVASSWVGACQHIVWAASPNHLLLGSWAWRGPWAQRAAGSARLRTHSAVSPQPRADTGI
jgi:hypothetical protein